MSIELYELVGADDRRFSPYCWRTRMSLAHKGLEAEIIPCRFTDKERIAFSGQKPVPVIRDGEVTVSDSWAIACYLEDTYPDAPSLFGGEAGRAGAWFVHVWTDRELHVPLVTMIVKDIHDHADPSDRAYFRESREQRFGATLEALQANRDARRPAFDKSLGTIRAALGDREFLSGRKPGYSDYIVFGAFQWARGISPYRLIESDDPIHAWRGRMLDLFDGLGRSVTAYPD
jgi:glutathione S-transferase